jgi:tetratricopeptide (TPR) repeat protein
MISLLVLLAALALLFRASIFDNQTEAEFPKKLGDRIGKLWDIAYQGMRENKLLRAEKALLTILNIDKKNAAAYNRLGILYAKQKEYSDAIDCFEIASSLEPSASSLHNLGLIYFETEDYTKASMAFEQALKLDDNLAARHIAYAKAQEKLGHLEVTIKQLERAVDIETNHETLGLLAKAYENVGDHEKSTAVELRMKTLIVPAGKPRRVLRPKRVIV